MLDAAVTVARQRGANRELFLLRFAKLKLLYALAEYEEARSVAKSLLGIAATRQQRGRVHLQLSNIEVKLGNPHQATWECKQALQLLDIPER